MLGLALLLIFFIVGQIGHLLYWRASLTAPRLRLYDTLTVAALLLVISRFSLWAVAYVSAGILIAACVYLIVRLVRKAVR